MEGHEHGLLEFHASTKAFFDLQVLVTDKLKTSCRRKRKWLVGGSKFAKMRVATFDYPKE